MATKGTRALREFPTWSSAPNLPERITGRHVTDRDLRAGREASPSRAPGSAPALVTVMGSRRRTQVSASSLSKIAGGPCDRPRLYRILGPPRQRIEVVR
jgi:hypothetical protein